MVDLGFLLITFFVFTTSVSRPNSLHLNMPADGEDGTVTAESKTLNLLLADDNKIYYYIGNEVGNQSCTDFSPQGVRKVIYEMQQQVQRRFGDKGQTVVLIRPTQASSYRNLVDILDEMLILDVKKYALMDDATTESLEAAYHRKPC